jgi:hypothetical protein
METKKSNLISIICTIIIAISILLGSYFIALGFRYEAIGKTFILDKWNKQIYYIDGTKGKKLQ